MLMIYLCSQNDTLQSSEQFADGKGILFDSSSTEVWIDNTISLVPYTLTYCQIRFPESF